MELLGSDELAALPKRIFRAADKLAREETSGSDEFVSVAQQIGSLERWASEFVPLRPLVTLTSHTKAVIGALVEEYEIVAGALAEEQLEAAQRASAAVQQALDKAAGEARNAGAIRDRAERVLTASDPTGAWIAEAFQGDPIGAIGRGQALLRNQTGRSGGSQSAVAAVIYDAVMSTICDPDEFWRLVRSHLQLLDAVQAEIPSIASDPLFASRLVDVTQDMLDSARRAAVAPNSRSLRAAATELLEAGHLLVEQPLKFHLGAACAGTTRMTFADTQAVDVSQLIHIAGDKGWDVRSGIGDSVVRNAFAHRDFEIVNDEVSLSPQRRRRDGQPPLLMRLENVQDRVLQLLETLAAMDLALWMTLEGVGVNVNVAPLAHFVVGPLLTGMGWSNVGVSDDGPAVVVSADVDPPVPIAAIAFPLQPFAGSGRTLVLRLTRRDSGLPTEVNVDMEAYAAWSDAVDEFEKEAAFLRMGHATLVNGQRLFSEAHVERFLAFRGCEVLVDKSLPGRHVARRIKTWRRVAQDAHLDEVHRELGKGLRLRLQAQAGLGLDPSEFSDLLELAGQTLPPLPDSLV